ncbi:MAG: DUF4386 domain-containing protein [Amaricoccus sp.]
MSRTTLGRLTGVFFLITFVTAIPAVAVFYRPAIADPAFVLGGGFDAGVASGAVLELALILANIATALTIYPVIAPRLPVLSLAYVAARLVECGFIGIGIVALLALNTLRLGANGADPAMLVIAGQTLVAIHAWTFRLGPGVVVGVGNGLILGVAMWRARLVPRGLSIFGIIGGPALVAAGIAVIFGRIEAGGTTQAILTLPEIVWELGLGLWLLARGFPDAPQGKAHDDPSR